MFDIINGLNFDYLTRNVHVIRNTAARGENLEVIPSKTLDALVFLFPLISA